MVAAGLPDLAPGGPRRPTTDDVGFEGPYIVKPRFGGSSIGIEVVEDLATARALLGTACTCAAGAVLEPFRPDLFDVQVALRRWPDDAGVGHRAPPPVAGPGRRDGGRDPGLHRQVRGRRGHGQRAPRASGRSARRRWPTSVRRAARRIGELALVRGVARIDFLTDGDELVVNEINTIPGSLARYLWIDPVVPFARLLDGHDRRGGGRPTARYSAAGADGLVLRGASSIAAKLA